MDNDTISALDETEYPNDNFQVLSDALAPPTLAESQAKQLELLQHLSLYSELLILVSAERGMGKTFIAQALLATRESPDQSLMIEADISLAYIEILNQLAGLFHLSAPSNEIEELENQIIAHCLELSSSQQGSMLLIIDQADQLSDETLEDLNHLALLAPDVLHLMLIAPPELEEKLVALPEPQAPVHVMNIEPLSDEEAETLLLQYFPTKEWSGEEVNYILQQSIGNPGKILYIAQELLSGKKISGPSKFPITHIAAMVFVLAALGMAYLYQTGQSEEISEEVAGSGMNIEPIQPISVQEKPIIDASEINNPDNVDKVGLSQEKSLEAETTSTDSEIDFNFTEVTESHEPVTLETKSETIVETPVVKADESDKNQIETNDDHYTVTEEMLLSRVNSDFVIQLFGSFSEKSAQSFIKKYSNNQISLSTYKAIYKNKPWHVVIAGPYKNREIAIEKSKKLPKELQQQKPWIRSIVPVKEQIKTSK